jgi:hypothetical protein
MPIPFKLDYVIEKRFAGWPRSERRVINTLAGVSVSLAEARLVWPRILDHKWYVSERLGRDVGLRVAAIDYFENIEGPRTMRSRSGTLKRALKRLAKQLGVLYLTHLSWKAHDGIFVHSHR